MARPQTDIEAGRKQLLEVVDNLVRQRGAADISMAELATAAGMSPSNIYRFFENKEALSEAVAEKWFAEKVRIMEEVVGSNLPARDKLFAFFARRFAVLVDQYQAEPALFKSYLEMGHQYLEVVRGYVDLGDHYLAMIVAEAMEQGYFGGLSIDETVSLINQMVQPYCHPEAIITIGTTKLNEQKLGRIIDTILIGLGKVYEDKAANRSHIKIVS
ncbi:MAG: TetR/AcrR family transcriptional regulator [Sphingorhabdus sp.]